MAKNRVSEWDVVSDNNLDIKGINISDNMPPSFVNDAMREMMAQIKQWQSGLYDESLTIKGDLDLQGGMTLNGDAGTSGQFLMSQGVGETPQWGSAEIPDAFSPGMIILWSGLTSTIPTGWALCNGTNGTPNLTDRFVIGAGNTYGVNQTGGSKDAVNIAHTHTGSTSTIGNHTHTQNGGTSKFMRWASGVDDYMLTPNTQQNNTGASGSHKHTFTTASSGVSGTNRNLPPYYALAYIMRK